MSCPKFNARFNFGALLTFLISLVLLLACYLTYSILPESDSFTNSIEVSGEQTVKAFAVVPVLGVLSFFVFIGFLIKFRKYFSELALADNKFGYKTINDGVIKICIYASSSILLIMLVISAVFSLLLFNEFRELGFVAPVSGTVYETYENFILADCIIHLLFIVLTTIKMFGISLSDSIGKLFNKTKRNS